MPWAGASNINHGVTFDLGRLNDITLSSDKTTVSLGPGATWSEVYDALIPHGVMVVGGRIGRVGVGGLILGGNHLSYSR